jgi:hypothetical protein
VPHAHQRQIARDHEKIRFRRTHFRLRPRPQHPHKRLLHDIIDILRRGKLAGQPRTQLRLVRLELRGKPLRSLWVLRGHSKASDAQ